STLARAIAGFYVRHGARKIAVGFDARESSPRFFEILAHEFTGSGIDVISIGMVPTPVLYHTVFTKPVDGGVMITGSHNPPDHNGFKICLGKEALFGEEIQEIKRIAAQGKFATGTGAVEQIRVIDDYIADIVSRIKLGSGKLKAVVDAGNGTGGITAVP